MKKCEWFSYGILERDRDILFAFWISHLLFKDSLDLIDDSDFKHSFKLQQVLDYLKALSNKIETSKLLRLGIVQKLYCKFLPFLSFSTL